MMCLLVLGALATVVWQTRERPQPLSVTYLGTTNDYYAVFLVTNRTVKVLGYAGGQLQLKTETRWKKASGRFRRIAAQWISSTNAGTVFVAIPEGVDPWRARLDFVPVERTSDLKSKFTRFCRDHLGVRLDTYTAFSQEITRVSQEPNKAESPDASPSTLPASEK